MAGFGGNNYWKICFKSLGTEDKKEAVKSVEESGYIFIISDHVHLRHDQVPKVTESSMPPLHNTRREDLEKMEKQTAEIDVEAEKRLHREPWFKLQVSVFESHGRTFNVIQLLGTLVGYDRTYRLL